MAQRFRIKSGMTVRSPFQTPPPELRRGWPAKLAGGGLPELFMIKRPAQRVAIFIDAQNMYHSAKHMFGSRVNFPAVVEAAASGRELIRAIAYVAKSKTGEEHGFFEALVQKWH